MTQKTKPAAPFLLPETLWHDSLTGQRASTASPLYLLRWKGLSRREHFTCHDYWELIAVISGRGRLETPNEVVHLERGHLALVPPDTPHRELSEGSLELLWLGLAGTALERFPADRLSCLADRPQQTEQITTLWLAAQAGGRRNGPELDGLTLALLNRFWREQTGKPQSLPTGGSIERALNILHERFAEKLSLGDLARDCGLSPGRFSRVFKQATGQGPCAYLEAIRLRHAQRLLETPGLTLRHIAACSGYQNEFYFSKAFKKFFGEAPDFYRRKRHEIARPDFSSGSNPTAQK